MKVYMKFLISTDQVALQHDKVAYEKKERKKDHKKARLTIKK